MPIQFRCVYCHQLLGIARRKAGAIVRCPSCDKQVVVPGAPEGEQAHSSQALPLSDPILEKSDFSAILRPPPPERGEFVAFGVAPASVATESGKPDFGADLIDVEPLPLSPLLRKSEGKTPPAKSATGIYLSPTRVTIVTVVLLVVLALVFGAGLLVGRLLWSHA